jgi:hypothetical protein
MNQTAKQDSTWKTTQQKQSEKYSAIPTKENAFLKK